MFAVKVTAEAKEVIKRELERFDMPRPGIMISRQGSKTDVHRGADGNAIWSVERLHPWTYAVSSMSAISAEDILFVDGISFWLALIPRSQERGIELSVRNGELFVDALPA
jgi:hypothetical protein